MTPVPYRGAAPAFTDVVAGRVDVLVEPATTAFTRIQNGQVRLLALSSAGRYPSMPEAPTVEETLPGVALMSQRRLAMVPGTLRGVADRLKNDIRRALTLPDMHQRPAESGNIVTPSKPA